VRRVIVVWAVSILLDFLAWGPLLAEGPSCERQIEIAPVWSGHPVAFALLTHRKQQLVAFYDADRRMTIGARSLDESHWQLARLPAVLGWDSHNYVTLVVDSAGQIHVSGNMHCHPLVYFRTERPGDITSFRHVPAMVGRNEERCTYPRFLHGSKGELIFTYRDGRSGSGDQYCNVYDVRTETWRHMKHGSGNWKLDPQTLKPVGKAPGSNRLPKGFSRVESVWPGIEVRTADDQGQSDDSKVRYLLRWETLPSNHDRPRPEPFPPPTMLRLYEVREE